MVSSTVTRVSRCRREHMMVSNGQRVYFSVAVKQKRGKWELRFHSCPSSSATLTYTDVVVVGTTSSEVEPSEAVDASASFPVSGKEKGEKVTGRQTSICRHCWTRTKTRPQHFIEHIEMFMMLMMLICLEKKVLILLQKMYRVDWKYGEHSSIIWISNC